jgi:WD40 repeat protein
MIHRPIFTQAIRCALGGMLLLGLMGCSAGETSRVPLSTAAASATGTFSPTIPASPTGLSASPTETQTRTATKTEAPTRIPTSTPALPDPLGPTLPPFALARLGKGAVAAMDLSPDERRLAVASNTGIYLYETNTTTETMKEVWFFPTTRAAVSVAFSPDGRKVAAGLQGITETEYFCDPHLGSGGILMLDAASGRQIQLLNYPNMGSPIDLFFSRDGLAIGYLSRNDVMNIPFIWTLDQAQPEAIADPQGGGFQMAWDLIESPDGKWLALSTYNGEEMLVLVLDAETRSERYRFAIETNTRAMSFSRNNRRLAAADSNGKLKVWDLDTGGEIASAIIPDARQLRFAADNRRIFVRTTTGIQLWDPSLGKSVWSLPIGARGITLSFDGLRLFSYDAETLTIRNAEDGAEAGGFLLAHESVSAPAYSADGKELLAQTNWGRIKVWDASTRRVLRTIQVSGKWNGFTLASDNRTLAVNRGSAIEIWDYQQGKMLRTVPVPGTGAREFAISPQGDRLALNSGEKIYLLDSASGKILMEQESGGGVAISPNGRLLAFSSADSAKIILWDITVDAVSTELDYGWRWGTDNFDFSPDGQRLGTAGYGPRFYWWSIADPKPQSDAGIDFYWPVLDIAFSPDGKTAAAGSYDIQIWELASGRQLRTLAGHSCYATRVMYSPDGSMLASGSADGTILLWDMAAALEGTNL